MTETKRARGAAARLAGAELPRWRFIEVGSSAVPGLDSARDRVREATRRMRNPLGGVARAIRGWIRGLGWRGGTTVVENASERGRGT